MGAGWKHQRSCERYISANKLHSLLSDCTCLGSFLRIGGGPLSASSEGKNENKGEDRAPSTAESRGRQSWMFSNARHLFESKKRHIRSLVPAGERAKAGNSFLSARLTRLIPGGRPQLGLPHNGASPYRVSGLSSRSVVVAEP